MPTWLKVILIIVAVFIALIVGGGYIGYRWILSHQGEIRKQAAQVRADADEFARGKDANACIAEAFARVDRCDGIMCEARTKLFLSDCLEKTGVTPDICAAVPRRGQIIDSARWAVAECARRGRGEDQRCTRLIVELQEQCWKR